MFHDLVPPYCGHKPEKAYWLKSYSVKMTTTYVITKSVFRQGKPILVPGSLGLGEKNTCPFMGRYV
jgi:hypothetical protein